MALSDNNQTDLNQHPDSNNRQRTVALSRDIEALNSGLRTDFDQKLGELADLLARFKALVITPVKEAANDSSASDTSAADVNTIDDASDAVAQIREPATTASLENSPDASAELLQKTEQTAEPQMAATPTPSAPSRYAPEPARFETGLYKLNCQLYRFRLELDQEMEFREEPLHIHFRKESELSVVLQNINDKSREINPDS